VIDDKLIAVEAMLDPERHCVNCKDPSPGRMFYARYLDPQRRLRGVCYTCVHQHANDRYQQERRPFSHGASSYDFKTAIERGDYD
jgi:hypothetical protein